MNETQKIKIRLLKRRGRQVLLVLEDNREILLAAEAVALFRLDKLAEIDDSLLAEIITYSDRRRANDYVNYLLTHRSYSVGQVRAKLKEKGYSREIGEKTIQYFVENGYLNDENFAREFIAALLRTKPAGKNFLMGILRQKLVARPLAERIVEDILQNIDEVQLAEKLLAGRLRYFSKFDLETARVKAYNYLSRRSISYRASKIAFENIFKEETSH